MKRFMLVLAIGTMLGCGTSVQFDHGSGGAGGTSTGNGAGGKTTGSTTSSSGTGPGSTSSSGSTTSSSGSTTSSAGSTTSSAGSTTTSASSSSSGASSSSSTSASSSSGSPCGVCPSGQLCCATSNPPHCYSQGCLACCMAGGTSSSSSGGNTCSPACGPGLSCCNGACVNEANDILNCGGCGIVCGGAHPFCNQGKCGTPPCSGIACPTTEFCCGTQCCAQGTLCCDVPSPVSMGLQCAMPVNGTCPKGCPLCP